MLEVNKNCECHGCDQRLISYSLGIVLVSGVQMLKVGTDKGLTL